MTKCPVCQKQRSEYEMRPLIGMAEIQVGQELTGEKSERDIAGAKVDVVCRGCWEAILKTKSKEEVIEMFETLCGLLFEMEKRANPLVPMSPYVSPTPYSPHVAIPWAPPHPPAGSGGTAEPTWIYKTMQFACNTRGADCESTNSINASKLGG